MAQPLSQRRRQPLRPQVQGTGNNQKKKSGPGESTGMQTVPHRAHVTLHMYITPNSWLAHPPQVVARKLARQTHEALTEAGNERQPRRRLTFPGNEASHAHAQGYTLRTPMHTRFLGDAYLCQPHLQIMQIWHGGEGMLAHSDESPNGNQLPSKFVNIYLLSSRSKSALMHAKPSTAVQRA